MPMKRHLYPPDWEAISARTRQRAGDKCEFCGVPNGAVIVRRASDPSQWQDATVEDAWMEDADFADSKLITIVLTVAHLDHNPANCADDNLRALCQRCHLRYDAKHHARNAGETRRRKRMERGQAELFKEVLAQTTGAV